MTSRDLSVVLHEVCDLAGTILAGIGDREGAGKRPGQYALDLAVDGPVIGVLERAGLGVLSEEAGAVGLDRQLVAVLDPVDGSTNASLQLPWYATSVCVVDEEGPLHSMVINHGTGTRFEAIRGEGASRNGVRLGPVERRPLAKSVVGVNGAPPAGAPWAQFRCLGASALDISAVAAGQLGGYVDFDVEAHGVWDYLGALLVCTEVGVEIEDVFGRDLVVLDTEARRTPAAATSREALNQLIELRREQERGIDD